VVDLIEELLDYERALVFRERVPFRKARWRMATAATTVLHGGIRKRFGFSTKEDAPLLVGRVDQVVDGMNRGRLMVKVKF
jgi:hypothetical protein